MEGMKHTKAELEKELKDVKKQIKLLQKADQDIWKAMFVEQSTSRLEGYRQSVKNRDEMKKLMQHERSIVLKLVKLEEKG